MSHTHAAIKSFKYATDGVTQAFKQEPNFRAHIIISILVLVASFALQISLAEWAVVILTITVVISLELINTAIEELIDMITTDFHPKAKVAKDVSAAAVLLSAISASAVGAIIFLPKLIPLLQTILK